MIFKRKSKFPLKINKGQSRSKIGLIFIIPAILSYILKLIPENPINVFLIYVIFTGTQWPLLVFLFYLFYKIKSEDKIKIT